MPPRTYLKFGSASHLARRDQPFGNWRDADEAEAYIVESWGEGFMFGALLVMSVITIANMRRGVILHKLILCELILAMSHGTFCFMGFNGYGWYLSSTAALLYCSYFTHNVVAWLKIRTFFTGSNPTFQPTVCKWVTWTYLITLSLTIPPLIFEIFNNFRYFNDISRLYQTVRPYEPLMRDPWWIFSCLTFIYVIKKCYTLNTFKLIRKSPRFGILLVSILLAISFTIVDICASLLPVLSVTDGINPYWKLSLVFKCLADNIMLDDFKSVLQRLGAMKLDDRTTLKSNDLSMEPSLRTGIQDDDEEHRWHPEATADSRQNWARQSISGRLLDDGETLDSDGYSRRRQSMISNTVGRLGIKIRKLGNLSMIHSSAEREAKDNMEKNKRL